MLLQGGKTHTILDGQQDGIFIMMVADGGGVVMIGDYTSGGNGVGVSSGHTLALPPFMAVSFRPQVDTNASLERLDDRRFHRAYVQEAKPRRGR